jgi:hypothetical protein
MVQGVSEVLTGLEGKRAFRLKSERLARFTLLVPRSQREQHTDSQRGEPGSPLYRMQSRLCPARLVHHAPDVQAA